VKFAAFIFGLLATAFALAVDHYFGTLRRHPLVLWPDSSGQLLGLSLQYLVVCSGLVGGLLVLPSALSGGLLMLAGACGWFALGASLPSGYSAAIVIPLVLCLLGSIIGVIAAGRPPRPAPVGDGFPSLEDIWREDALTRDLGGDLEGLAVPEVRPEPAADVPRLKSTAAGQRKLPRTRRPPLLLVLSIVNFVLLLVLTVGVLVLYFELNAGSH
jgi:hypothetical protein